MQDSLGQAKAFGALGLLCLNWGQYHKASEYFGMSLGLFREIGDGEEDTQTLTNMGDAFQHQGVYEQALTHYRKGITVWQAMKVPSKRPKDLMVHACLDKGQLREAEELVKDAGNDATSGRYFLSKEEPDYGEARECYGKPLRRLKRTGTPRPVCRIYGFGHFK